MVVSARGNIFHRRTRERGVELGVEQVLAHRYDRSA
jgi:hypothetical protein